MVKNSPPFTAVADTVRKLYSYLTHKIFRLLNGKIWAGHNIMSFDNKSIQREFQKIGKTCPQPAGLIDTYPLLRKYALEMDVQC